MSNLKIYHELKVEDGYVLDPFYEEEHWVYRRSTSKYFMDHYNLTLSQLWNICHGFDKDQLHYCNCGELLTFKSLSCGFYKHCSTSCSTKDLFNNPEFKELATWSLNSVESQAKGRFTQFLQKGSPNDNCYFYLATSSSWPDWYKFGVTADLRLRWHFYDQYYDSLDVIREGTRLEVASIERDLKIELDQNHEYIKPDLKDFVVQYVLNYKLSME